MEERPRPITVSDLEARPGSPSIVVVPGSRSSEEELSPKPGSGTGSWWLCVTRISRFFLYSYILYIWTIPKASCESDDSAVPVVMNEFEKYSFFYICKRCEQFSEHLYCNSNIILSCVFNSCLCDRGHDPAKTSSWGSITAHFSGQCMENPNTGWCSEWR